MAEGRTLRLFLALDLPADAREEVVAWRAALAGADDQEGTPTA